MPLLLWLLWVVAVIVGATLFFWWFSKPARRRVSPGVRGANEAGKVDPPVRAFLGGLRWPCRSGVSSVAGPFARLQIYEWGVRAGPSLAVLRVLVPTWEAAFDELAGATAVRAPISAGIQGVRFELEPPGCAIVFWTARGGEVLDHLDEMGIAVVRDVTTLHLFSNS